MVETVWELDIRVKSYREKTKCGLHATHPSLILLATAGGGEATHAVWCRDQRWAVGGGSLFDWIGWLGLPRELRAPNSIHTHLSYSVYSTPSSQIILTELTKNY